MQNLPSRPMTNGFWGEVDPIDAEDGRIAWGADHAVAEMRTAVEEGRPFFVRWDPSEPHLPNVVPEPWASMVDLKDVPPWPSFPDDLANKPVMQRKTRERWGCDGWAWQQWQPIVARYLGEIMLLDHHVGRVLAALDEAGGTDDTLVIYSTDHGDFCGGHGMVDKHYAGYDDILRVPLIARWPGKTRGRRDVRPLSRARDRPGKKRFATAALGETPETFVGRDLLAEAAGEGDGREDVFVQYSGTQQGRCDQRYLRTRRWKYVYCPVSEDELYDLDADPGELTNLIDAAEHGDVLHHLRERMTTWMKQTGDKLTGPLWTWPARSQP